MSNELPKCPNCGWPLQEVYENNGFEPPEGPPHYDLSHYKCGNCENTYDPNEIDEVENE